MTTQWLQERRQSPRVAVRAGSVFLKSTWSTVQLLDISLNGVLLASSRSFAAGRHGELRAMLGSERLAARVEVRREELGRPVGSPSPVRLGAAFVTLDERARHGLETFLSRRLA